MKCSQCGGHVTWRGPFSAFTHTECHNCGAINAQVDEGEPIECDTCEGTGKIDERLGGYAENGVVDCPDCNGYGEL